MHLIVPLILTLAVVPIQAKSDLVCLGWGITSPVFGLICHFKSEALDYARDKAVATVNEAVQSTKDLLHFDLTHNPVAIAYDFLEPTFHEGDVSQGLQNVANIGRDYQNVTIGFGKQSINQGNQIRGLMKVVNGEIWTDTALCLIQGGTQLAYSAGLGKPKNSKRAGATNQINLDDALQMAERCISNEVQDVTRREIFNITDPNQQIGATISDIAALLVPLGGEEVAGAKAVEAVDLAIPGSEATTTVMKLPEGIDEALSLNTEAEYFTNEAEARRVRDNMKDEKWAKDNCHLCKPPPSQGAVTARTIRGRPRPRLLPRGNVLTSCCRAENALEKIPIVIEGYDESWEPASIQSKPVHNPEDYNYITEGRLKQPIDYILRDPNDHTGLYGIRNDLNGLSTSVIPWSPDLLATTADESGALTPSENLFKMLRSVFTGPEEDPLYKALEISERDGRLRMNSWSKKWMEKDDAVLAPIKKFAQTAAEQGLATVQKVKKLTAEQMKDYDWEIEFFYTAPSDVARTGTDPRGFHWDFGTLQFAASDTPGLVILNSATETAERVKIYPNTFHLMKALDWNYEAFQAGAPRGPTFHSVFGPEMAKNGRVSMILDIYNEKTARLETKSNQ
ncbi:MAG: hypothetical protein Q9226_003396 [Calogaya cf. arnoldii]